MSFVSSSFTNYCTCEISRVVLYSKNSPFYWCGHLPCLKFLENLHEYFLSNLMRHKVSQLSFSKYCICVLKTVVAIYVLTNSFHLLHIFINSGSHLFSFAIVVVYGNVWWNSIVVNGFPMKIHNYQTIFIKKHSFLQYCRGMFVLNHVMFCIIYSIPLVYFSEYIVVLTRKTLLCLGVNYILQQCSFPQNYILSLFYFYMN